MDTDQNLKLQTHAAAPVSAPAAVPTVKTYPEQELTGAILQAVFAVHNTPGAGFLEPVYSNALAIESDGKGLPLVQNEQLQVKYRGTVVGDYVGHQYSRGAAEFRPPEIGISKVRLLK
jgi:hypothetical protein